MKGLQRNVVLLLICSTSLAWAQPDYVHARTSKAQCYQVIYREFEELGERTNPVTNDDAVAWAARLRNKNPALSEGETKLLEPVGRASLPDATGDFYPANRNGEGVPRDRAVADKWTKCVEEHALKEPR